MVVFCRKTCLKILLFSGDSCRATHWDRVSREALAELVPAHPSAATTASVSARVETTCQNSKFLRRSYRNVIFF
jgi:hypothetical protein